MDASQFIAVAQSVGFKQFGVGDKVRVTQPDGSQESGVVSAHHPASGFEPVKFFVMTAGECDYAADVSQFTFGGEHYSRWHTLCCGDAPPVAQVSVSDAGYIVSVDKSLCTRCECFVVVAGHAGRCDPSRGSARSVETMRVRRRAWLGDALLLWDVRVCLLASDTSVEALQSNLQSFVSNATLADVYDELVASGVEPTVAALGPSVSQRASAFEASYFGDFREAYLVRYHGTTVARVSALSESLMAR